MVAADGIRLIRYYQPLFDSGCNEAAGNGVKKEPKFCDNFEGGPLIMHKTGDAASARSEEMLSTRLETGENRRTVKHNQRKVFTVQPSSSHQVWVLVTR